MNRFDQERQGGLFIQVLDWMLAPLVVLWPAAVFGTYFAATVIADASFDRELLQITRAVADEAQRNLAADRFPVLESLRTVPLGYYVQVADPNGGLIAGDAQLPRVGRFDAIPSVATQVREVYLDGDSVRVAYMLLPGAREGDAVVVQVAEQVKRRQDLVGEITFMVMVVIMILVPVTVALVWFGLRHGVRPLVELSERVERRDPSDLTPIAPNEVPQEVAPLVTTLNRQLDRVRANLEAQRRFVADAAHQMRTPLAGLRTQAEAALRAPDFDHARDRLDQIQASADRMSRLVAQLLALARVDDAAAAASRLERVELNAMLRGVCETWADKALSRGVSIGFEPAAVPVEAHGLPLLLPEVFSNLVDNAIRYTPPGGEVEVRVRDDPPRVSVEDTGMGIPPADRELVFQRFHRVLGTPGGGSGLGLPIVKMICVMHGASIAVEDGRDGRGTRFVVTFPPIGKTLTRMSSVVSEV